MVLGESNTVFATDGTHIVSIDANSDSVSWSYPAPETQNLFIIAATFGNGLVAKTVDPSGGEAIIRFQGGSVPTFDPWTAVGYKAIDFVAGDSFMATSLGSGPAASSGSGQAASRRLGQEASLSSGLAVLVASGRNVDWALNDPWSKPQQDNRAEPKIKINLSVSNIYDTTPGDRVADAAITATVNNARIFWWKKAKIQLDWDHSIQPVKSCDPILYPLGCGSVPTLDLKEINSSSSATEFVRRFCTPGLSPKCKAKGSQLVFNDDEGTAQGYTPHPLNSQVFMNISAIAGLATPHPALEDSSTDDSSDHDVSHELGHQFQLHHIAFYFPRT